MMKKMASTGRLLIDRQLKQQFILDLNDDKMLTEIIFELTAIQDTSVVTIEQVLAWARQIDGRRSQNAI